MLDKIVNAIVLRPIDRYFERHPDKIYKLGKPIDMSEIELGEEE